MRENFIDPLLFTRPQYTSHHFLRPIQWRNITPSGENRMTAVDVEKLTEGLWRWTGEDAEGVTATSLYLETPSGIVLLDPVLPREAPDEFLRALDRDVARVGGTVTVVLTAEAKRAQAGDLAERYGATVLPMFS